MFSYLVNLLSRFQSRPVRTIALAALALLVVAVLLGSFVRWLRRRRQDRPGSWAALAVGSIGAVLKVLIGLGVLTVMCLHLAFQSAEFARLRGGTSTRNYNAVTTIWGRPHVQRELSLKLVFETTHYHDKDGLEIDPNSMKASSQPVRYRKQVVQHTVAGNPIVQADHEFVIRMNYRKKGGAWYPGFETDATFNYRVENFARREVTGQFSFPMPARQGLVDRIRVLVDGKPVSRKLVISDAAVQWQMPMPPGASHAIVVGYHSRGLDHLRFEPGPGREMEKHRIRMVCVGVAKDEINYPVGCMTPTEGPTQQRVTDAEGEAATATTLGWNLDRAVTRLGMGVILPKKKQAGYYVARVLAAAPWGLVLLLAMVVVTHLATGDAPHWLPLALLAVSYHLYYLLMAHVGDYWPLVGAMIVAGVILTALTAAAQLALCRRLHAVPTLVLFAVFCAAYPLIRISDSEGLLLTVLYVVQLAYVVVLLIWQRRRTAGEPPAAS